MVSPLFHRVLALALTTLIASAADEGPAPLTTPSETLAAINHALIKLSQGEVQPLEALPTGLFLQPIARPDPDDANLARRWTLSLAATVARLDGAQREQALAALDRCYRARLPKDASADQQAELAGHFLPAPAAVTALTAAADRAFDRGDFQRFLALGAQLAEAGRPPTMAERRAEVATRLVGRGPEVDRSLLLPAPGEPIPTAAAPEPEGQGLAVGWRVTPGYLMALDPWGNVEWQYRLGRAEVVTGPCGALVEDHGALSVIDESGHVRALPPAPPNARVLSVAGGAAWFATGATAYRLDLATSQVLRLALPTPPLAAPLVRGASSLWLTEKEVLLFSGDHLEHRLRHGLKPGDGWHLGIEHGNVLVVTSEGRNFRMQSLDEQLGRAEPLAKARLLVQAGRYAEALAILEGLPGESTELPEAKHLALVALIGAGGDRALGAARFITADTAAQDAALYWSWFSWHYLKNHGAQDDLPLPRMYTQHELFTLAQAHSEVLFTPDPGAFVDDPQTWDHAITSAGVIAGHNETVFTSASVVPRLVQEMSEPFTGTLPEANTSRDHDGLRYQGRRLVLERSVSSTEVRCYDAGQHLLWRHRWAAPSLLAAPSRSLSASDGWLIIGEGQRLTVLELDFGRCLFTVNAGDSSLLSGLMHVCGKKRLAVLTPLGVNTDLVLIEKTGSTTIRLPSPAHWLIPFGQDALVALSDGRALRYPGGEPNELPVELVAGAMPAVTSEGLVRDGKIWRWKK